MKQKQEESAAWDADCDLLAAELLKVPETYWPQILRDSLLFIADMESVRIAVRLIKNGKTTPSGGTGKEKTYGVQEKILSPVLP